MSRYRDSCPIDCKVYVGELGTNGTRHELEEAFGNYGRLRNVWVATNPPGFAFVMFEDSRDAKDACRGLDGKMICGRRVRVEMSTGKTRHDKERYGRGDRYNSGYRSGPPRGPPRREYGRDSRREGRDNDKDDYRRRRYSSAN
jgi:arginine/serine-rich splicing factor 3